ncbi:MAG TPA: alpha/beta hydrolase [Acidimicrobiales bacterium]|nr:alpha/beta hydrolase [Acidimicrobiales bacterium]
MSSKLAKLTIATAAVGAGYSASRKLSAVQRQLIAEWTAAESPDDHDVLTFPQGDEFRVTTSDGAELAGIDVAGSGPTVVLIHGYAGTRGHWGPVALRLAEAGHRVVAYEQRGHGDSTVGDDSFTMAALGSDLRAVLEHLDLRNATIAGHSMGGMALQSYLGGHPDSARNRTRLAMLTSTAAMSSQQPMALRSLVARVLGSAGLDKVMSDPRRGSFGLRNIVGTEVRMSHLDGARRTVRDTNPATRVGAFEMLGTYDNRGQLSNIGVPVIIAVGTHDQLTPIDQSRQLDELIQHARLHVFPGAGHMLPWERSAELSELVMRATTEPTGDGSTSAQALT